MSSAVQTLLGAVGVPLVLGTGIARALGLARASDPLAWLGWSWIAGAFGTAVLALAWSFAPLSFSSVLVVDALALALAAALHLVGRRVPAAELAAFPARPRAPAWERALFWLALALVLAVTLARIVLATLEPVVTSDEGLLWAFKAKLIFAQGGLGDAFLAAASDPRYLGHEDYPLLNPLLQVWTFAQQGRITHVANRIPIALVTLAAWPILASGLRRLVRPAAAAALLLALAAPDETIRWSMTVYSDALVGVGLAVALDAWLRWRATRAPAAWRLSALGLAFALWGKNEGLLWGVCALAAGLALAAWPPAELARALWPRARHAWLLLPLGVVALTWALNAHWGFANDIVTGDARPGGFAGVLARQFAAYAPSVGRHLARSVVLDPTHSALLPAAYALLVLAFPLAVWRRTELRVPAGALALAAAGLFVVFCGTPHSLPWHLKTAGDRVGFQVVPALALAFAATAGALLPLFAPRGTGRSTEPERNA